MKIQISALRSAALALGFLTLFTSPLFILSQSHAQGVEFLGQTRLMAGATDSDLIRTGGCNGSRNSPIQAVQIRVVGAAPVEINQIVLRFGDNTLQTLPVRSIFQPGSNSKLIDLVGGARCVTEIFIRGRTLLGRRYIEAQVQVWGIRQAVLQPVIRRLGITQLDFNRDADVIQLACPNPANRFQALKIAVTGSAALINDIKVEFGNGQLQDISVREIFQAGTTSRIIDLPGQLRCIRAIYILGKSLPTPGIHGGKAMLEVFGLSYNRY